MSRYRKVDPRIWNDAKFRALSDQGKLGFFFLLTHPHMTGLGAMRATIPGLAAEIGWSDKAFREAFADALSKGMVEHDEKAALIWLPKFMKYNPPESPNVVKAWEKWLDFLPECSLLSRVVAGSVAYLETMNKGFAEALPEAFAKAMPNQEQEQEQEQEQKEKDAPALRARREQVAAVFDHWRATLGHERAALDDKRTKLIERRLKDGYTAEQLCNAITGCSLSPFHMGENEHGRRYDGLDLILRDAAKVDQFLGFFESPPKPKQHQNAAPAGRRMTPAELYYQQAYGKGQGHEPTGQQNELDITGECQRVG